MRVILMLVLVGLFSTSAQAKLFRNAYLSFELPPNWNCKLEGSEWICENDFAGRNREALIILTAKEAGPADTLPQYLAHLQNPIPLPGPGGKETRSQVMNVKERMIGNHTWIDGLHLGSEVTTYFSRYVVTIKERISILVSFTAHKDHYTKYSADFIRAVDSLKVVATKDTLGDRHSGMGAGAGPNGGMIGQPTNQISTLDDGSIPAPPSSGGGGLVNLLIVAILLGAVGGYFYLRSNKPKSKKKKKK
jgi:hypothetical protein